MIADLLTRLQTPRPLSGPEAAATLDRLVDPQLAEPERTAVLLSLTLRAPGALELARLATALRRRARPFALPARDRPIDLCGSGGAPRPSFNVSTVSAFVVSGAGVPVVKHGNRSARGPCGSSDLLLALGLPVDRTERFARVTYDRFRLAFLHAPLFHPALQAVAAARRTLGVPTVFNRLGPLANPARVAGQVVGVPTPHDLRPMAAALRSVGVARGVTMSSADGCDEFSPRRPTRVLSWSGRRERAWTLDPTDLLEPDERVGPWGALPAPAAADEAERILAGGGGARRGSVLLTSGAALWVAREAPSLAAGVRRAREALDDGRAERRLEDLRLVARAFEGGLGP